MYIFSPLLNAEENWAIGLQQNLAVYGADWTMLQDTHEEERNST